MENKNLLLFFPYFRNEHIDKDVGMIPLSFLKYYGFKPNILTFKNEESYRKSELNLIYTDKSILKNYIKNLKLLNPKIVIFFHVNFESLFYSIITKLINKNIYIYIKGDINFKTPPNLNIFGKFYNYKRIILLNFYYKILNNFCTITVETYHSCEYIKNKLKIDPIFIPNGYEGDNLYKVDYNIKENIVFTMSRLGTHEKNTKLFLDIAKYVIEKNSDIKFYAIGDVEQNFKNYLKDFYEKNQHIKNNIVFTGYKTGNDKIDIMKKSKIFILTSKVEGFSNVYSEAGYYGNYIVTTNVGGAYEITDNGNLGSVICQENKKYENLVIELGDEILNNINNIEKIKKLKKYINNYYLYSIIINNLYSYIFKNN